MFLVASAFDTGRAVGQLIGIALVATLVLVFVRRSRRGARWGRSRTPRRRGALIGGGIVAVVLAIASVATLVGTHESDSWSSKHGRELHAGFLAGCRQAQHGVIDCDCAWSHLIRPPYDTPSRLEAITDQIDRATKAQDVNAFPPAYRAAVLACRI